MLSPIIYHSNSYIPIQPFTTSNVTDPDQDFPKAFTESYSTADFSLPSLIKELQKKTLEKMVLDCNGRISEDQLQELANAIDKNTKLKIVEIANSDSKDTTLQVLTKVLGALQNLEVLRLKNWPNGSLHVDPLANSIANHSTLRVLELEYRVVFPDAITKKFVAALASITNLEVLTLYCSGEDVISTHKVEMLADALEQHPTLKILNLCGAKIRLRDALFLLKNKGIVELALPEFREKAKVKKLGPAIAPEALPELEKCLLETLEKNTTLLSLSIDIDFMSSATREKCETYLIRNRKLVYEYFLVLQGFKKTEVVKGEEGLPKELVEFIYKKMFGTYLNCYSETMPERSEGTLWRGKIETRDF